LDVSDRNLPSVGVWTSDRRRHCDRGMPLKRVLDQLRVDVVAAADNQFLAAACQPEIAVRILAAEIAGIEPRSAVDLDPETHVVPGVEVTAKDIRPVNEDRPDLVGVGLPDE